MKELVLNANNETKNKLESLLRDELVEEFIDEHVAFQNIRTSASALWSLLLMAGYLKSEQDEMTDDGYMKCKLKIPNKEVLGFYRKFIKDWISGMRGISWYEGFLKDLLVGNIVEFTEKLRVLLEQSSSYHDISIKTQESFYHGLLLGLIVGLGDQYVIKSNR